MMSRSRSTRTLGLALFLAATSLSFDFSNGVALAQIPAKDAFSREPKDPLETWELASYLLKIGQPELAAPYVKKFIDSKPDDKTLLDVRDTYGSSSILMLSDSPLTQPYAKPLADLLAQASIRNSTNPERIERFVAGLSKSREEQTYAVERLREAGPYAVPFIVRALSVNGLNPEIRTPLAENVGRLDRKAVPALIATLDSTDQLLVGEIAHALGLIGDPRAVPALTYIAARTQPATVAKPLVVQAIQELTGKPFYSQPRTPARVLSDESRNFHTHAYKFPGNPVVIWVWDESEKIPKPVTVPVKEAEAILGLKAAKQALDLDPNDVEAKVNQISLGLAFDPAAWKAPALESGPEILGKVVRQAIADGRSDLAATATTLLGQISKREALSATTPTPLTEALFAPDRRVQFAAADALVKLEPKSRFLGSSRVIPVLARFVGALPNPRAIVIDGNAERASLVAGHLRDAGYDAHVAATGAQGFTEAVLSADVELIAINPNFINDRWKLADTLGNLKADARTAGIPTVIVGPLALQDKVASKLESFPKVGFLVTPSETNLLKIQLDRIFAAAGVTPMTEAERADYARKAASLIAQVARQPRSPFETDLVAAEPSLAIALNASFAPIEAARALGDIPGIAAQRSLADVALDPSKAEPVRLAVARELTRNIRRFGPKLDGSQEGRLVKELDEETNPLVRDELAAVVGALKAKPDASAARVSTYRPSLD